jgi:hypothetical protein
VHVDLICRGYVEPIRQNVLRAANCQGHRDDLTVAQLGHKRRLTSYDPSDHTYICSHCWGMSLPYRTAEKAVRDNQAQLLDDVSLSDFVSDATDHGGLRTTRATLEIARRVVGPRYTAAVAGRAYAVPFWDPAYRAAAKETRGGMAPDRSPDWLLYQWTGVPKQRIGRRTPTAPRRREIRACRRCGLLLKVKTSSGALRPEVHMACLVEAKRLQSGRDYQSAVRRLQKEGKNVYEIRRELKEFPIPPLPRVKKQDPRTLSRAFDWLVRNYLGGVPELELAREANVSKQYVSKEIKRVLALLPPPDLVDIHFRPWVVRLQAAKESRAA